MARKRQEGAAGAQRTEPPTAQRPVIEGSMRLLGVRIEDRGEAYQPQIALWVDAETGLVHGTVLIDPRRSADGGAGEAVEALLDALPRPRSARTAAGDGQAARPRRKATRTTLPMGEMPERVLVDNPALATALREAVGPLGVEVEERTALPAFEDAFGSLAESLGATPDGSLPKPFSWDVDTSSLPRLFKAAAAYRRLAPWDYMPDNPPLAVSLGDQGPEPGVETLYVSILGAAGEVLGAAFYFDLEGLRTHMQEGSAMMADDPRVDEMLEELRRTGAPVDSVPPEMLRTMVGGLLRQVDRTGGDIDAVAAMEPEEAQAAMVDAMVFSFDPADEMDPTYLQWLGEHGIRIGKRGQVPSFFRSRAGQDTRDLTDREVRALTLGIEAVNAFFTRHGEMLSQGLLPAEPLTVEATVGSGDEKRTVPVTFPAPGFDWEEDNLEPATAEQAATLYRFQVKLDWRKSTWRRIEMRGDQTLHDLHGAIQDAFDWDNDHLYAFFLSGKAWDTRTEYSSPYGEAERAADQYRLAWLPLRPKQQFLYIFDFGDELRHQITVEEIVPGGVRGGEAYPRITGRKGENEPQYPGAEE